jgi:hypothetical protein
MTVGIDPDPAPIDVHRRWPANKPGLAEHSTDDLPLIEMLRSAITGTAFVSRPGVDIGGDRATVEGQRSDDRCNKCLRCQRSRTWRSHGALICCAAFFQPQANPLMRSRRKRLIRFIRERENCPSPQVGFGRLRGSHRLAENCPHPAIAPQFVTRFSAARSDRAKMV